MPVATLEAPRPALTDRPLITLARASPIDMVHLIVVLEASQLPSQLPLVLNDRLRGPFPLLHSELCRHGLAR